MQSMVTTPGKAPQYRGISDCFIQTVRAEGLAGLYRGIGAPILGVSPMFAICFVGYDVGKGIFCDADAYGE